VIGAILLGLFVGIVGRMITPRDAFRGFSGPVSWLISVALGLLGALVGYAIFTLGLGIGDDDIFDWGGVVGAIIGVVIVILIATPILRRIGKRKAAATAPPVPPAPPPAPPASPGV
jgi:uncharacterized membrane protein YeaQ/YmgE (transglycosylase-associated protein family)